MRFWDYIFDSDHKQRRDIEELRQRGGSATSSIRAATQRVSAKANAAQKEVANLRTRVDELERDLGMAALFMKTVKKIMIERNITDADEFLAFCKEIDIADGNEDGKSSLTAADVKASVPEAEKTDETEPSYYLHRK